MFSILNWIYAEVYAQTCGCFLYFEVEKAKKKTKGAPVLITAGTYGQFNSAWCYRATLPRKFSSQLEDCFELQERNEIKLNRLVSQRIFARIDSESATVCFVLSGKQFIDLLLTAKNIIFYLHHMSWFSYFIKNFI